MTFLRRFAKELLPLAKESFSEVENKELKAITVLLIVLIYVVFKHMVRPAVGYIGTYRPLLVVMYVQ